ncbi:hypothetical protein AKO1_012429 [Acrasis kona]|uniref:Uncharacterized protein n=1 Tax=Acrasis kona TaxID=1008807 RepID=A0AAW2YYP0_9EUKA
MHFAADLVSKEVEKYEVIQEKIRTEKTTRKNENEEERVSRELKSALLLQSMYNLEDKEVKNQAIQDAQQKDEERKREQKVLFKQQQQRFFQRHNK